MSLKQVKKRVKGLRVSLNPLTYAVFWAFPFRHQLCRELLCDELQAGLTILGAGGFLSYKDVNKLDVHAPGLSLRAGQIGWDAAEDLHRPAEPTYLNILSLIFNIKRMLRHSFFYRSLRKPLYHSANFRRPRRLSVLGR